MSSISLQHPYPCMRSSNIRILRNLYRAKESSRIFISPSNDAIIIIESRKLIIVNFVNFFFYRKDNIILVKEERGMQRVKSVQLCEILKVNTQLVFPITRTYKSTKLFVCFPVPFNI